MNSYPLSQKVCLPRFPIPCTLYQVPIVETGPLPYIPYSPFSPTRRATFPAGPHPCFPILRALSNRYELSYSLKEAGRYSLHVLVGGKESSGSPFHVVVAAGCRSGAVEWPCLGRGMCLPGGKCECTAGYLGKSCQLECPGMDDDGQFCSGRGNCTLKPSQVGFLRIHPPPPPTHPEVSASRGTNFCPCKGGVLLVPRRARRRSPC